MAGRRKIGILALQGAFSEHQQVLQKLDCAVVKVRSRQDLGEIDGLIIPGGESTAMARLLVDYNLADAVCQQAQQGMPIFGTCAGMIVLAREIEGSNQYCLGLMAMEVCRNGFGRQVDSFEAPLKVKGIASEIPGIFIRAPYVKRVWDGAEVLAKLDQKIVAVRQGNLIATSFHPELTDDMSLHEYFLRMV